MSHSTKLGAFLALAAVAVAAQGGKANAQGLSTLKITATGTGATVQATPMGRLTGCTGLTCTYEYPTGTPVTLTAASTVPGASLATWEGGCGGAAPTCSIVVSGGRVVAARFTPVRIYADEQVGKGTVSITPPSASCGPKCWSVPFGTEVVLRAAPAGGYAFDGWSGTCASVSSTGCRVTARGNVITSPVFECATSTCSIGQPITHEVNTVVKVQGSGYVDVNGTSCKKAQCSRPFKRGKVIVLRAVGTGGTFRGWKGSCGGLAPRCQFPAFKDFAGNAPSVTAVFG